MDLLSEIFIPPLSIDHFYLCFTGAVQGVKNKSFAFGLEVFNIAVEIFSIAFLKQFIKIFVL